MPGKKQTPPAPQKLGFLMGNSFRGRRRRNYGTCGDADAKVEGKPVASKTPGRKRQH